MIAKQAGSHTYDLVDNSAQNQYSIELSGVNDEGLHASNFGLKSNLLPHSTCKPVENDSTHQDATVKRKWWNILRLNGWRVGVFWGMIATTLVLILNITWTIWAVTTYGTQDGRATIFDGSCKQTKALTIGLHLAINILGTILLGASNYCMQCLVSPTRMEIDRAHSQRKWLDVGVPSIRNMLGISKRRRLLWLLLALSSIPLHLLFNSTVFSTLSSNSYTVNKISEDLATAMDVDVRKEVIDGISGSIGADIGQYPHAYEYPPVTLEVLAGFRSWQRRENIECMELYGRDYLPDRGHVMLVTSQRNNSQPIEPLGLEGEFDPGSPFLWMCVDYPDTYKGYRSCSIDKLRQHASNWTVLSDHPTTEHSVVQYCISQQKEEHCSVQLHVNIMAIVIVANCIKIMVMLLTLRTQRHDPLVTLGDAIKSFLKKNDPTTSGTCLKGKAEFISGRWSTSAKTWHPQRPYWFQGASKSRLLICNAL